MKNKDWGRGGRGRGGLYRDGGLINFPPLKRGGLFERGGGLIKDLRYDLCSFNNFSGTRLMQERNSFVSLIFDHFCFNQSALSSLYRLLEI